MIHQVILIPYSMSEPILWIYFFVWLYCVFAWIVMLGFDSLLLFKFILFLRSRKSLWGLDVLLFLQFMNIAYVLFYNFTGFIILLHTFLVVSFSRCKEYIICLISLNKCWDELPAFTCASATRIFQVIV